MATYVQLVMLSRQRLHLHLVNDKRKTMYVKEERAESLTNEGADISRGTGIFAVSYVQ